MAPQHQQWLKDRKKGIGGSDAACILGLNPYKSNVQLWEEKTGRREPEDISSKDCVDYGKKAEAHLRELFKLDYPEYSVDYDEFGMIHNSEYPFIFATLDGDLTERQTSGKGILEIKTTEIMRAGQYDEWKGDHIPENYYIQVLHQLLATGYDFVILKAQIKFNFDKLRLETKHYHIEQAEVIDDLEYLKQKEVEWWTEYVVKDVRPPLILPQI